VVEIKGGSADQRTRPSGERFASCPVVKAPCRSVVAVTARPARCWNREPAFVACGEGAGGSHRRGAGHSRRGSVGGLRRRGSVVGIARGGYLLPAPGTAGAHCAPHRTSLVSSVSV